MPCELMKYRGAAQYVRTIHPYMRILSKMYSIWLRVRLSTFTVSPFGNADEPNLEKVIRYFSMTFSALHCQRTSANLGSESLSTVIEPIH
jgi:hypothetical protein